MNTLTLVAATLALASAALASTVSCEGQYCTVTTTSGRFNGTRNLNGLQWRGIHYGQAPVGDLRMADPQEYFTLDFLTLNDAFDDPPMCPQIGVDGTDEDCLYVNVYRPYYTHSDDIPVMVWIHGGSFFWGGVSDPTIDASYLANTEGIIVVTIQYRLGLFGFFDDGSDTNFAVKDALLALKWVNQNIGSFGGDVSQITVAGESSGATMVRALLSTEQSVGLFRRAIMQSDPMDFGFMNRSVSTGTILGLVNSTTGCTTIACMRTLSIDAINAASYEVLESANADDPAVSFVTPLMPVIDGDLLTADFAQLVDNSSLPNPVPLLVGVVKNEANGIISEEFPNVLNESAYENAFKAFFGANRGAEILATGLFNLNSGVQDAVRLELGSAATLFYWKCPTYKVVNDWYTNLAKDFFIYEIDIGVNVAEYSGLSVCGDGTEYVCHQGDLELLFNTYDNSSGTITADQAAAALEVQRRWGAFVTRGNPNPTVAGEYYATWSPVQNNLIMSTLYIGQNQTLPSVYLLSCGLLGSILHYDYQVYSE
ncbi:Carboxylesterase [Dipodascopsis tothii]|uniref:Carboxylesterase n=1 Tax=Dipodascopsis tothii TaxID=44089 RepID=UPI0034CF1479